MFMFQVSLEAAKVLSNLIHQSSVVQSFCSTNGFLARILAKIQLHPGLAIQDHNIKVNNQLPQYCLK